MCLLAAMHVQADPVDAEAARQKAAAFLQGQKAKGARRHAPAARQLTMAATGPADSYYIFNAQDGQGYVVVSGEDATEDILGYSNSGTIDTTSMPCGMKMLLDNYADQIKYLRDHGITREQNQAPKSAPKKSYMINSTLARFGQEGPYNGQCPKYLGVQRCLTGCVATAMAELMYYYRWPHQIVNDIPAYTTDYHKFEIDAIPSGTMIDWINILPEYDDDSFSIGDEQRDAVANLMKCCGASVRMDFGVRSSDAHSLSVPYALKQYFGYEVAIFEFAEYYENLSVWYDKLRNEIEQNKPVYYRGVNNDGEGHAFLLEGYDGDYFYVNLGWNGRDNDFFLLNVIKDKFTFVNDQGAIFNVTPKSNISSVNVPLRLWTISIETNLMDVCQRTSATGNFDLKMSASLCNYMPSESSEFDVGISFKDRKKETCEPAEFCFSCEVPPYELGITTEDSDILSVGKNLSNGRYMLYFESRETGTSEWVLNDNSQHAYAEAWVCDDWMSLKQTTNDNTNFTAIDIEQTETKLRVGTEATFNCHIFNSSTNSKYYDGGMLVNVVWTDENGVEQDKVVYIDRLTFTGNGIADYTFKFIPFVQGEQTIKILNKRWEVVGLKTINVSYSSTSLNMLEVTELTLSDGDIDYGLIDDTTLRGTLYIKNNDIVPKKDDIIIGLEDVESPEANRTKPVAVSIAPNITASYNFSFGNLTAGHHYVVTASYASGEEFFRSPELLCTTDGMGEVEPGNEALIAYEYWFDEDYAGRERVSMSGNKGVVRASINTDHLQNGLHFLHFRVQSNNDKYDWSGISTSPFLKLPKGETTQLEYWFDDDIANSQTLDGKASSFRNDYIYINELDMKSLSVGLHRLSFRAISKDGQMKSAPVTCYVIRNVTGSISRLEYWFDYDRDHVYTMDGRATEAGTPGYIFNGNLNISGLRPGHHRLHYRGIGSDGQLSTATGSASILVKIDSHGDVVMDSYSISVDGGVPIAQGALNASKEVLFSYVLDAKDLEKGWHTLQTTFWNSYGMSVTEATPFEVLYGDDDAVSTPQADEEADGPIYNLSGMRVNANAKGILIKNGKKFFVK